MLYALDAKGRMAATPWPAEWLYLRSAMANRAAGLGRPPNVSPESNIIELPLFSQTSQAANPIGELEWMILDINENYIRTKVLPQLAAEYLNPDGAPVYDVSVTSRSGVVTFSTRTDHGSVISGADGTAGLFPASMGAAFAPARRRSVDEASASRWVIAARHRSGSLDAAVARARTRNLVLSLLLVALLGGTAFALVRYTARSRRLSEMQFRFAAGVSHDLRTPLTAITGAAFNLADGVVKEPVAVARYAKLILRNARELTSMVENILSFSASLQSGKTDAADTISVGDLLRGAASAILFEAEQVGCRMEVNIAPELPLVAGDPVSVELVFRNLIGNAVRHGASGKWIGVSAAASEHGVEVRVRDRGPGVPALEHERVFEPFYRGERTRTNMVPGTGLGLSLVRSTIERYKGTVQIHDAPGGGAEVIVRLPAILKPV